MSGDFLRSTVRQMHGYTPGEQPERGQRIVKLNTNENPFPPSAKVMAAIRQLDAESLRRYPDPQAKAFCAAAAGVLGVQPEMIMAGNGSDDILTIITRACLDAGGVLAAPEPTYTLYPVLATIQGARYVSVPWENEWQLPIEGLLATRPGAIYVANPNAPSGTVVAPAALDALAKRFRGLILIDEAYVDFARENCLALVDRHAHVVITRTFSKAYSLAGLRFGFAVAQPQVIAELMKVKDSYNTDALSMVAAQAAILDQESARRTWKLVREERERVTQALEARGWKIPPSQANFLLATCPDAQGRRAYEELKAQGVLVRYFDKPGLTDKLRITIGTRQDNDALLAAVEKIGA